MERKDVDRAAKRWAHRWYRNASSRGPPYRKQFLQSTSAGWVRRSNARNRSSAGSASAGDQCSLSVRGCGEGTFAEDNRKRPTELEKVLPADEEEATHQAQDCGCRAVLYLSRQERMDSRWNPRQSSPSSHVRPLWRTIGWTKPGIADAIRGPRVYQHEQLPLGPSWADVLRLLASTETNRKADIRDRPILLLLAVYGLRVGEVQRLRLDDINWEQKTISITATKQHRTARVSPLIPSLADAIARYIREVRPQTDDREILLRLNAPRRPFRHGRLWRMLHRLKTSASTQRAKVHIPCVTRALPICFPKVSR